MITIQDDILLIGDPTKTEEPVEISLDEKLYPDAIDLIMAIKELVFEEPEKAMRDVLRLRKLIWQFNEFIKYRLNTTSQRNPDYAVLEEEFKNMKKASVFVVAIIQMLETGVNVFQTTVSNPVGPIVLN